MTPLFEINCPTSILLDTFRYSISKMSSWNLLVLAFFGVIASGHADQWPKTYYVEGFLRLPYAEINEPFVGWYEGEKNRSRIDYYGTVSTYQIGSNGYDDYGYDLKVAPMTTEEFLNVKTCFRLNGTDSSPVASQILLPDLSDFEVVEFEVMNGENCTVFYKDVKIQGKKNVYKFYQSIKTKAPVRYEMLGYDTLLGSHYDRYFFDYTKYRPLKSLSDKIFTPPKGLTCRSFPGPGVHRATMNPMNEYFHHDVSHVDEAFQDFTMNHGKQYDSYPEHVMRKAFFHQNLRYIHSKNRQGLGYTLAVNHLADKSDEELRFMRGSKKSSVEFNGGLSFNRTEFDFEAPPYFDWRLFGAVTPVKDQATCGSCWSFGTTGCLEGAHFLKTGELVRLSSQELVDCSWGEGNNGCDGGEDFRAYQWIMKHGLASEENYGAYLGQDGYCKMKTVKPTAFMKGYVNITSGDLEAVKLSMFKYGPISVAIDASHKSLSFYSNGVYYEPECGNKVDDLDHAVLAVGYGTLNGEDYWLIKNSWSTYWGNDGYILMSQKNNNCGVATSATYVIM